MSRPVTVTVDVPVSRQTVFEFLDVMANHESFTDHMLVDWECSGPPAGVGSKAAVTARFGGSGSRAVIEVLEAEEGRMIREQGVGAGGRRVTQGTYELSDLPDGGTHISFTFETLEAPLPERVLAPLLRSVVRRGNARAMERLAERLA